jgi:hypothetical protein
VLTFIETSVFAVRPWVGFAQGPSPIIGSNPGGLLMNLPSKGGIPITLDDFGRLLGIEPEILVLLLRLKPSDGSQ